MSKQNKGGVGRQANHQPLACRTDGCHRHDSFTMENQQDTTLHGAIRRNRPPAPGGHQGFAGSGFRCRGQDLIIINLLLLMKKEEILALFKRYEEAVCMIDETECWSARDLQKLFGYSLWQNFTNAIAKVKEACNNVGQDVLDHFIDVNKMVELGSGAQREVDDIMLTRWLHRMATQESRRLPLHRLILQSKPVVQN